MLIKPRLQRDGVCQYYHLPVLIFTDLIVESEMLSVDGHFIAIRRIFGPQKFLATRYNYR